MNDILVYDDLVPEITQQRFLNSVTDPDLHWMDFGPANTAGDWFKQRMYSNDKLNIVPSDSLIKLVYYNDFKEIIHQPEHLFYMSLMILDLFSEKSGIKPNKIIRMKINSQTRNTYDPDYNNMCCNDIHTDTEIPHKVLLYYINDSDGDTFVMNERFEHSHNIPGTSVQTTLCDRISPKQGRIVCFDGLRYHAPSNPIENKKRYILNINFI